jgi:hypothetical protein
MRIVDCGLKDGEQKTGGRRQRAESRIQRCAFGLSPCAFNLGPFVQALLSLGCAVNRFTKR